MIDIPPGAIVGLLDDFWQRSLADVGLPGPDAGNGGKFLLLPPGYDGDVPPSGYHVLRATMHNHNLLVRGIIVDDDMPDAVERVRKTKVYPWSERENPKPNKFVSISGVADRHDPPGRHRVLGASRHGHRQQPGSRARPLLHGHAQAAGHREGKPFQPDARQTAILEEAAELGDAMARNIMYEGTQRDDVAKPFPGTGWDWVFLVQPSQEAETYSQLDERLQYTYGAIYLSPALGVMKAGPGTNYVQTFRDKDGNHFDGAQSYRLHVPANPPAAAFWSLTLYDSATRSMVQNPTNDAARSSYDDLKSNDDGSVDLYFGPDAPAAREQLARDGSRQGLLPDVPLLQPHRAAV